MSGQHTPGPWHTYKTTTYIAIRAQARIQVAQLWKSKRAPIDQEADARLIASAPDLLEALNQINMLACYASEEATETREAVLLHIGETARAAIAKAEGGAS